MRYRLNDKNAVAEELDGEVIVIHLQSGAYYSMQATAADIWRGLIGGASAAEINAALHGDEGEVQGFASQLLAEGLIAEAADRASAIGALVQGQTFVTPELQKYTDMQDWMLVDPIHEVGEEGWPVLPKSKL